MIMKIFKWISRYRVTQFYIGNYNFHLKFSASYFLASFAVYFLVNNYEVKSINTQKNDSWQPRFAIKL